MTNVWRGPFVAIVLVSLACGGPSGTSSSSSAPSTPSTESPARVEPSPAVAAPMASAYPPPVKGHHQEANTGNFDLVDGIAWTAKGGAGTVVYAVSKPIASPALASSPCPMTEARSLTTLRDAGWVEVTLDAKGKSKYFSQGTAFGGTGREEDVGGRYWQSSLTLTGGNAKGEVRHTSDGAFEFDLPVLSPRVTEVSESDRIGGKRSDPLGVTPTEQQIAGAYRAIRAAAMKKDLAGVLSAQGFDAKQIAAIRALPGIDADFAVFADRFLEPDKTGELQSDPGYGGITAEGANPRGEKFTNFYVFTPCQGRLVLTHIYENAQ
jgi:hypothetical protein